MPQHPFDSVLESEIRIASKLVKDAHPASENVHFLQIDRLEPPKQDMIKYLIAERSGASPPPIPRRLYLYYQTNVSEFNKALVNVTDRHIITKQRLPKGVVGPYLPDDLMEWEEHCITHPIVLAEIEKLQLPKGYKVRTDPWIYATDDPNEKRTMVQFFMYVLGNGGHAESNHYSLPLKFSPVFEAYSKNFVRIDYLPGSFDETVTPTGPWQVVEGVEYHPELNGETQMRHPKPLIIQQPEGASFSTEGSKVKWLGWEFRVATSVREGFVVYDGWFKGRQVFYRISLSEMTVPYGDPRAPFHRKQAFDLGDCGFGANANVLKLGCDCLGVIKYLDGITISSTGKPRVLPNTVCMHEQDAGILYKHMNYRTEQAVVARKREFVVQTIATVANYEYILNLKFTNDGIVDIEVRATGILSTMPIDENVSVPWGTTVGPNVMAAYHQHILSFRIDPAIDGHRNSVLYEDIEKMPRSKLNPFGIGFVTKKTFVDKAGSVEQSPFTNRTYKIVNENKLNPITNGPVGYKILMPAKQMLLADVDSFNSKRATFATKQLWVTKYHDDQLYAAGEFTNQSQEDSGIGLWVKSKESVRNDDVVVWATMGFTHIPRVEDFPVMPVETHNIHLVPANFFDRNPGLDLPLSNNNFNRSVLVDAGVSSNLACCGTSL